MPRAANAASGMKPQVYRKFEDCRPTLASLARLVEQGARGTGVICGGACWGEHAPRSGLTNNASAARDRVILAFAQHQSGDLQLGGVRATPLR